MKKLIISTLSLLMLVGLGFVNTQVKAATNEEMKTYTTEEGDTVVYSETAVNGNVDLGTPLILTTEQEVDKSKAIMTRAASKEIFIPFQTQQTDYYCGPAAARMVLGGIGYSRTQNQMASLLGTTVNGTNAGNSVANALNSVVAGSRYQFRWQWHTYTDIATIKSHVLEAINYGNPVMVNTMESPGDVYLQGHNIGTTLYHFGVVADYFDYGNTITYTDPGAGRFSGFVVDQRASITNLSYATGGRGYAW